MANFETYQQVEIVIFFMIMMIMRVVMILTVNMMNKMIMKKELKKEDDLNSYQEDKKSFKDNICYSFNVIVLKTTYKFS